MIIGPRASATTTLPNSKESLQMMAHACLLEAFILVLLPPSWGWGCLQDMTNIAALGFNHSHETLNRHYATLGCQ